MVHSPTVLGGALIGVLSLLVTLQGQETRVAGDPPSVARRLGPLALAPTLTLSNVGWDSNVFNQQVDDPDGDFTATIRPELQGWLRLRRLRLQGRSAFAYLYFREYAGERSWDADLEGRISLPLMRITPYISGSWISARERFGYEIDERIRRYQDSRTAGVEVRLGARTKVDVAARRGRLEFDHTNVGNPLISDFYDYTSHGVGVRVERQLTPLTSVAVNIDRRQDRFDLDPNRDSNGLGISSGMEFKPFALFSGKAYFGWQRVEVAGPASPTFSGYTTSVDLAYTLLGATRFTVEAQRELEYSAMRGRYAYLLSGGKASVTHRLGGAWDVGGSASRHRLSYGVFELGGEAGAAPEVGVFKPDEEIVRQYTAEIGYRIVDTRLAFTLGRQNRRSTVVAARQYARTYANMSVTYGF